MFIDDLSTAGHNRLNCRHQTLMIRDISIYKIKGIRNSVSESGEEFKNHNSFQGLLGFEISFGSENHSV